MTKHYPPGFLGSNGFPVGYLEANAAFHLRNAIRSEAMCTLCGAKGHFPAECPMRIEQVEIHIPKHIFDQINAL